MKYLKPGVFILLLSFVSAAPAETGYAIQINEKGYELRMKMHFNQDLGLVRRAFKSGAVLSQLSPHVKSVINTPEDGNSYESVMTVKSYGLKSELVSKCTETFTPDTWTRHCVLQTEQKDSGKFMKWKKDQVICRTTALQATQCEFAIDGQAKDIALGTWVLFSAQRFSVPTKLQAMNNFFHLYFYISDGAISAERASLLFANSAIKNDLDVFAKEAAESLKKNPTYLRTFHF